MHNLVLGESTREVPSRRPSYACTAERQWVNASALLCSGLWVSCTPPDGSDGDISGSLRCLQVLQLSDQQIALLPPDQRQSIMVLKEQIARSTQQ